MTIAQSSLMRVAILIAVTTSILLCASGVTLEDELKAWWLMGENAELEPGDGTVGVLGVPDHSANSAEAAGQGSPERVEGVPFSPFPFDESFAIRTSEGPNYLRVASDPSIDIADEDFSVSLWARAENGGGRFLKLFQRNNGNNVFWQAESDGAGAVIWNIRSGNGQNSEILTNNIFAGNSDWHHLVFLRDTVNQELRAYVDGVPSLNPGGTAGVEADVSSLAGSGTLAIGAENNGVNPFIGEIDDVRVYDRALTDEEVAAIYKDGEGDFGADAETAVTLQESLRGWWLMGENAEIGTNVSSTIIGIPDHTGNSVTADARGTPQRVAGVPFSPHLFDESTATRSGGPSYLLAPDDGSFNFEDEDFSVSLWARSENGGGQYDKLFQRNVGGNTFWQAETANFDGSVIWNIRSGDGQNAEIQTNNIFSGNTDWHHLVFLRDTVNQELRAYVDGVLSINPGGTAGNESDVNSLAGTGDLGIGAENNGAQPFVGDIDDFRIYGVALSDEEVLAIYNGGLGDLSRAQLRMQISHLPETDELVINWDSQDGKLYNLRSEIDPSVAEPGDWPILGEYADIAATPPENTLTIARPGDPIRFLVVEEFNAPPVSIFSDDFEGGQGDWETGSPGLGGTAWELGAPSNVGPDGANSPSNCFGTNLAADYDLDADVFLRSPVIDLSTAGGATVTYFQFRDIEEGFDAGSVVILDASDNTQLAELQAVVDGTSSGWEQVSKSLPPAALGKMIKIQFRLTSDDIGNFAGWYLDDVTVTVP